MISNPLNYVFGLIFEGFAVWAIGSVLGIGFWRTLVAVFLGMFVTVVSLSIFPQPERTNAIIRTYKNLPH